MDEFFGVILVKKLNVGSKSEGFYSYLILDSMDKIFKLYRKDTYAVNDNFLMEFDRKNVRVFGEVQQETWLMVEKIEELIENEELKIEKQSFV